MATRATEQRRRPQPFAFVLMPFTESFLDVYKCGIKEACRAAGVRGERVDEQRFLDVTILERIYRQIQAADVIIADMTGRNPNVFYEVGYAHAIRKRVILLTKDADDIPFDLKLHRHIVYGGSIASLKSKLAEELKWCIRTPAPEGSDDSSRSIVRKITRILAQVSKSVAGRLQIKPLLDSIVTEVADILDAEVCSIFLNSEEHPDVVRCVAGSGFAQSIVDKAEYRSGEGFTGKVFQRAQPTIIHSSGELKQLRERDEFQGKYDSLQWAAHRGKSQFRNGIAWPLKIGDETIGVIKVENKRDGQFSEDDYTILDAITNGVLAVAVQNARLLQNRASELS